MAGAKCRQNLVSAELLGRIGIAFEGRPCVVFGSDMKVRIEKANVFRYPDASALCGSIDFFDGAEDAYSNPVFIAEVLSESTRHIDRNEKFAGYSFLDSFTEYLLVESDEIAAELHRKGEDGRWTCESYSNPDDELRLESIGVSLRLGNLYAKVEFPPAVS